MPNSADGTTWTESQPANTDARNLGAQEIRGLRTGLRTRLEKEHVLPAASNVGGEHIAGSAVAYRQDDPPTNRPDPITSTSLTSADNGRLWVDSNDSNRLYVYVDPSFVAVAPATINADSQSEDIFTDFVDSSGWTNDQSQLVLVTIAIHRTNSIATTRSLQVQNVANTFQTLAEAITISTVQFISTSVLVPDANVVRITPTDGLWSGTVRYSRVLVT